MPSAPSVALSPTRLSAVDRAKSRREYRLCRRLRGPFLLVARSSELALQPGRVMEGDEGWRGPACLLLASTKVTSREREVDGVHLSADAWLACACRAKPVATRPRRCEAECLSLFVRGGLDSVSGLVAAAAAAAPADAFDREDQEDVSLSLPRTLDGVLRAAFWSSDDLEWEGKGGTSARERAGCQHSGLPQRLCVWGPEGGAAYILAAPLVADHGGAL